MLKTQRTNSTTTDRCDPPNTNTGKASHPWGPQYESGEKSQTLENHHREGGSLQLQCEGPHPVGPLQRAQSYCDKPHVPNAESP